MASDEVKQKKSKDKSSSKDKKHSEEGGIKKEKKDKKKDKAKQDKLARALDAHLQADAAASVSKDDTTTHEMKDVDPEDLIKPAEELVPFALPLADEKAHKKVYKLIKKGAKLKAIHRGVKECEKAIKKTPLAKTGVKSSAPPPGLVVIAADISPMDVIMHFPILCEEHGVPYVYIRSRADLGVAACTKRATSVVMLRPEGKPAGAKKGEDEKMEEGDKEKEKVSAEDYQESWRDLVKLAEKQWAVQVEPWVKGTHPLQLAAAGSS
ncbi:L30e-like protein [Coniochaeta ligniaria NRRL 30616]|uniref:L30e-like protein n=1 Tax=Coniochaeta ligniaria NRRL 30616 TaxID=1408157 RepID=A0A1J7J2S2_9PEZI|nr:L30e-like protein [Coniochaeta ligniaria NRRL 30616]